MFRFATLLILSLTAILNACSSKPISYGSDFKSSVDFSLYKTYSWHAPNEYNSSSDAYIADPLVDKKIRSTIDQVLAGKGFKKLEDGQVDFLVNYSIITTDEVDISSYNNYNGYVAGWRHGGRYGAPYQYYGSGYRELGPEVETTIELYKQGTFVLDIVGVKEGKLEWRGTAEARMPVSKLTPEKREHTISEVVGNVLKAFPPS